MSNKLIINQSNSKKEIDKQIQDAITASNKDVDSMVEVLFDKIMTKFNNDELYCFHNRGMTYDLDKRYSVRVDTYSIDIGKFTLIIMRQLDDDNKLVLKCENTKNEDEFEIVGVYKDLDVCDENDYIPRMYHYLKAFNTIYVNSNRKNILDELLNS